jgi:hypothetical protein
MFPDRVSAAFADSSFPDNARIAQQVSAIDFGKFICFCATSQAMIRYTPQPYLGRIIFFCADESMKQNQDPSLGWAAVAAGSITTHNIPGNHYSIIESKILAQNLRAYLN